jgi:hypothetical protein
MNMRSSAMGSAAGPEEEGIKTKLLPVTSSTIDQQQALKKKGLRRRSSFHSSLPWGSAAGPEEEGIKTH